MTGNLFSKIDQGANMKKVITCAICLLGILAVTFNPALGSGLSNARAIGMAGAYSSLARGFDCPYFNPANLGIEGKKNNGFQLVGVGAAISNNSFSLDDYNKYTGATLSEGDKATLLSKIPAEGLKVSADVEASALSFGFGNIAISFSGYGAAEISISHAVAELLLNGNTLNDTLTLNGTYGEGFGVASANFSYGRRLYHKGDRQLAAGLTFKYVKGFGYEEITHLNGEAVTLATGFEGSGSIVSRTALGGSGYAVDLGGSLKLNNSYTVGVTVFNILNNISWNKDTEEHRYSFEFDTLTVTNMSKDDIITSSDTTVAIPNFSTKLPSKIRFGFAKTTGSLLWAVEWEQGFKKAAGSSSRPRITSGAEYHLLSFLPIRAGFGIGGKRGVTYAGGLGINASAVFLDFAIASYNAISGASGKGLNFALNMGFRI
ncbi:MAG: DUF5723 family protein [candidate division Zixibacteria bacterium]